MAGYKTAIPSWRHGGETDHGQSGRVSGSEDSLCGKLSGQFPGSLHPDFSRTQGPRGTW